MRFPAALAVLLSASTSFAAETTSTLSPLVDADAAVHLAVKPQAAAALLRWARTQKSLAGEVDGWVGTWQARLGFDPSAGLGAAGLADDAPIVISIGSFDPGQIAAAFRARADRPGDAKALARAPRTWVHSRLVAGVVDEKKLIATLQKLGEDVAVVLELDAKAARPMAAALKAQKVLAVARVADGVVFMRVVGKRLIVDHFWLFGDRPDWKRDLPAVKKVLAARPGKKPLGALEPPLPWTARPADPAFLFAIDPVRFLELGKVGGYTKVLAAAGGIPDAAQARSILDTGEKEVLACDDFRPLASEGPLAGLVVSADFAKGGLELKARWTLRTPGALDQALATSDDAIVDLAAAKDAKILFLAPLAGTRGLRELPRPGVLAQGDAAVAERSRLCGWGASSTIALFGWLHQAGAMLEQDGPQGALWKAARNLVVAVKTFDPQSGKVEAVALASVEGTPLHAVLDGAYKRGKAAAGKRKLDRWSTGQNEAIVASPALDARHTIYGFVFGGDAALAWWWGQPSPPSGGGPAPFVALLRADLPWFGALAERFMGLRGLGETTAGLGALRGLVTLTPAELTATLAIDVK